MLVLIKQPKHVASAHISLAFTYQCTKTQFGFEKIDCPLKLKCPTSLVLFVFDLTGGRYLDSRKLTVIIREIWKGIGTCNSPALVEVIMFQETCCGRKSVRFSLPCCGKSVELTFDYHAVAALQRVCGEQRILFNAQMKRLGCY